MVSLTNRAGDKKFYVLLQQSTNNIVKMAKEFNELVHVWDYTRERVKILSDLEQDGDAITHDIFHLCYRSFITPLDREDLSAIASALDDVADRIHSAADVMMLYKIDGPTETAKELTNLIEQTSIEVEAGVASLFDKIKHEELRNRTKEINHLENVGDRIYRKAVVDLLSSDCDDAYLIKWRKVYELMESTMDGCEFVADVLEGIALKYT